MDGFCKEKENLWGMYVIYSFVRRRFHLWGVMEAHISILKALKNEYMVCSFVKTVRMFVVTASSNQKLSTDQTSGGGMCTKCSHEINSEMVWRGRQIRKHKWRVCDIERKKIHNKRWPWWLKQTLQKNEKLHRNHFLHHVFFLKTLDKKAVLQTIGYQHMSIVPQCLLVEA